jgi:hypothetical protein
VERRGGDAFVGFHLPHERIEMGRSTGSFPMVFSTLVTSARSVLSANHELLEP